MLLFDRTGILEVIDDNNTSASEEYDISPYRYFLDKRSRYIERLTYIYNGCYDLLMISMNLSDIAILNIKDADY